LTEVNIVPGVAGIGARQVRIEDEALLTGCAKCTADMPVEGVTYAVFVRSPFAHARISSIDSSAAASVDGVVAVLTDGDLQIGPVFFPAFAELSPAMTTTVGL
jgi:carbon-monoxide dehydrogenase large subunit